MSSHTQHPRRLVLAAALATLAGCATTGSGALPEVRWPLPPDTARVKWVRSVSSEFDLEVSVGRKLVRAFVPPDPADVVGNVTGIALSPDESAIYAACATASKVLRIDLARGRVERVANEEGRKPASPSGVALDAEGNLYVVDRAGDVWVYAPDGKFLRRFGNEKLDRPTAVALDRRRQLLYVADGSQVKSQNHRVEVFSLRGEHLRTIGTRGPGPGQFNFPTGLTVAPDGRLFVVDMLNFRVQIFDAEGGLLGMFGSIGAGAPGTFDKAKALAFDSFGNIYVVDGQQGYVQVFNPRFQPLMAFGGRADLPGYMWVPNSIVIDSKNNIWVGDFARRAVSQYQLINTSAEDSFSAPAAGQPQQLVPPGAPPPAGGKDHPGDNAQDG